MHPPFTTLFNMLRDCDVAIIGSALRDYDTANDVDVLFFNEDEFRDACVAFGVKYNGWNTSRGHVRRANVLVRSIGKPVQFIHMEDVTCPDDHPHMSVLVDGTVTHDNVHYDKPGARRKP